MIETEIPIDADTRRQVVEGAAHTLEANYVFPAIGRAMSQSLLTALSEHKYDHLGTPDAICDRLTADLQTISRDLHIRVRYNEEARSVGASLEESSPKTWRAGPRKLEASTSASIKSNGWPETSATLICATCDEGSTRAHSV